MNFVDETAEIELIGNLMNDPNSVLEPMGILTAEDFSNENLGRAFLAFVDAYNSGEKPDTRMIAERAKIPADLLAECIEAGWMTSNVAFRVKKIAEFSHKRTVYAECRKLVSELQQLESQHISERLSNLAASISIKAGSKKVYNTKELCLRVVELQEKRKMDKGEITGAVLGYDILDAQVRGLKPKRTTFLAAGTGFGKTTLALNLFANMVFKGTRCLFLSNENDVDDNLDRLCGLATGTDLKDVESGHRAEGISFGFHKRFGSKTAFISDNAPRSIEEVCATLSRYAVQDKIEVAIVDYIGEISGDGKDRETEEAKLARYGQRLVDCAKAMGIHIIILAQLNREGNNKGRPSKSQLAGCFKLAQKAHTMLLFWQDEDKNDIITVEKNRQGPAGVDVAVDYNRATQRIKERGIYVAATKEVLEPRASQYNDLPD